MKRLIFLSALLLGMTHVYAEDVLTVSNVTLPQNTEVTLEIKGSFETNFTQFQMEIVLDEGLGMPLNRFNLPWSEMGDTENTDHTITASQPSAHVYRFVGSSNSQMRLPDSEVLMRVKIIPDGLPEVGTVLHGTVRDIVLSENIDGKNIGHKFDDMPFTVTIGEPADTRTLLDENATVAPTAAEGVDVRVKRTIPAKQWCTICLPFSMTAEQCKAAFGEDVKLADFSSWQSDEDDDGNIVSIHVGFTDITEIESNHPVIIKTSKAVSEFTVDGVNLEPEEEPSVMVGKKKAERGYFIGTYSAGSIVPESNLFLSGNKFWYSTGETKMKGLRGYFELADVLTEVEEASARISIVFDGETTGVGATLMDKGEMTNDQLYNLSGQRVEQPTAKGIYIKNHKKIIVK